MSTRSPGVSLPGNLDELATSSWYAWQAGHEASAEDPRAAYLAAYRHGWRDCFFASTELAGLVPLLRHWIHLLEDNDD